MRPRYETHGDLENEQAVATAFCDRFGLRGVKLSESLYGIDWAFFKNTTLRAYGEVKCRTNPSALYPTYMLSAAKWSKGRTLALNAGVPFIVIVRFTDGIFYFTAKAGDPMPLEVKLGGRADRGDRFDQEPVIHIPMTKFTALREEAA